MMKRKKRKRSDIRIPLIRILLVLFLVFMTGCSMVGDY